MTLGEDFAKGEVRRRATAGMEPRDMGRCCCCCCWRRPACAAAAAAGVRELLRGEELDLVAGRLVEEALAVPVAVGFDTGFAMRGGENCR